MEKCFCKTSTDFIINMLKNSNCGYYLMIFSNSYTYYNNDL